MMIFAAFHKFFRVLFSAIRSFFNDDCYLRAAALTFYTLLSIVPLLAVALGIAKGFGFEPFLQTRLLETFSQQKEVIAPAISIAETLLLHTQGGVIAGVGVIVLLWSNFSLLSNIERSLNDIWRASQSRSWMRKLSNYLAAMILFPICFVASSSLTVFIQTQIIPSSIDIPFLSWVNLYFLPLLKWISLLLIWILFTVIYILMPHVKIRLWPRIFAGVVAGTLFQFWQWLYIHFQVVIFNYGTVYGTFAALPLFLVWLQTSWLIFLFGAELAAQIERDEEERVASQPLRKVPQKQAATLILERFIRGFAEGSPLTSLQLSQDLGITQQDLVPLLDILVKADLLIPVADRVYQIRRDLKTLTIGDIEIIVDNQLHITAGDTPLLKQTSACFANLEKETLAAQANITLDDLQHRTEEPS